MRRVIWDLFELCPTPEAAVAMEVGRIEEVIRPLGLQKKRARMIQKFSREYLGKDWSNVAELHGIGKYVCVYLLIHGGNLTN
jgi:methyl-CpG-binding domain protein 4